MCFREPPACGDRLCPRKLCSTRKSTLKISRTSEFSAKWLQPICRAYAELVPSFFPESILPRQAVLLVPVPLVPRDLWLEFRGTDGNSECVHKRPANRAGPLHLVLGEL